MKAVRARACLCVALGASLACAERPGQPSDAQQEEWVGLEAVEFAEDEPDIETLVFLKEPVTEPGPGRLIIHVLIPGDASENQMQRAMMRLFGEEAEADSTLVAMRAIAYVSRPTGPNEAALVPVVWGEWSPPQGWEGAQPDRQRVMRRVYTYIGAAPEW